MPTVDQTWMVNGQKFDEDNLKQLANAVETYTFKHIPVTGTYDNPNTINIVPGVAGGQHIRIDGILQSISAEKNKVVPNFTESTEYADTDYVARPIKEQEEEVHIKYGDGSDFNVNPSKELTFKIYRGSIGHGYNGVDDDCYCTLIIESI